MSKKYKAYCETPINWHTSQKEILDLLKKHGVYQTRFTNTEKHFAVEFLWDKPELAKPIAFRLSVGFESERDLNRLYRVLFFHLKSKFVAIEAGLTEMVEEFMPYVIMIDGSGQSSTAGNLFIPKFEEQISNGEQPSYKLLEGKI